MPWFYSSGSLKNTECQVKRASFVAQTLNDVRSCLALDGITVACVFMFSLWWQSESFLLHFPERCWLFGSWFRVILDQCWRRRRGLSARPSLFILELVCYHNAKPYPVYPQSLWNCACPWSWLIFGGVCSFLLRFSLSTVNSFAAIVQLNSLLCPSQAKKWPKAKRYMHSPTIGSMHDPRCLTNLSLIAIGWNMRRKNN